MHVCTLLGWIEEKWIEECCELLGIGRVHLGLVWGFRDVTKPQTLCGHTESPWKAAVCGVYWLQRQGVFLVTSLNQRHFGGQTPGFTKRLIAGSIEALQTVTYCPRFRNGEGCDWAMTSALTLNLQHSNPTSQSSTPEPHNEPFLL